MINKCNQNLSTLCLNTDYFKYFQKLKSLLYKFSIFIKHKLICFKTIEYNTSLLVLKTNNKSKYNINL